MSTQPDPDLSQLWLVGGGVMGGAMLRRWVSTEVERSAVTVIDPSESVRIPHGVRHVATPPDGEPEVLVLAVKPQLLDTVAPHYAGKKIRMLVSILAGVDEAALQQRFDAQLIVRAMPNLPVEIGRGVVLLHSSQGRPGVATRLMAPLGAVEWLENEAAFDKVTALTGCGPAFLFRFIEAMAQAGKALGLPAEQADRLALATVEGASELAVKSGLSGGTLADRVASRGGSTREGLNVLDRDDALNRLLAETLAESARRNAELGKAARG